MKLTNLKLTKKEKKDIGEGVPISSDTGSYPYGLTLHLEGESIKKLGLEIDSFSIGDKVKIEAVAEAVELSKNRTEGKDRGTIRLQIQDMALNKKFAWSD